MAAGIRYSGSHGEGAGGRILPTADVCVFFVLGSLHEFLSRVPVKVANTML